MAITTLFVQNVLKNDTWTLGNNVLYELCRVHPGHSRDDEIAAKIWLIGRSYAASIERRRKVEESAQGDNFFYNRVIPMVLESNIDDWIRAASSEPEDQDEIALRTHKSVQTLFCEISGLNKRSLASKYLHFHAPKKFFFYDTRAAKALASLSNGFRTRSVSPDHDRTYAGFVQRCRYLNKTIAEITGALLSPRDFDKVLLEYIRQTEGR